MSATMQSSPARRGRMAALAEWCDQRLGYSRFLKAHVTEYYAPKNFNFWYYFGVLSLVALVLQLLTGIFLTMFYKVGEDTAFDSHDFH